MDCRGARILSLRIAIGAAPGQRVQVMAVDGDATVEAGDLGTLVSIEEASVRVGMDSGEELVLDPLVVQLRRTLVA